MNTKRIIFWLGFIVVLALIMWGLIVAMNKPINQVGLLSPAAVDTTEYVRGPRTAPVTIIEYGDFECPACRTYFDVLEKMSQDSPDSFRLVFRHFPLPQHSRAILAAQVAESAGMQGKFWDMYKLLYSNQKTWSDSTDAKKIFVSYAETLKLDMIKFNADLSSAAIADKIAKQKAEGEKIGINATPTFFVNGKPITNPQSYEAFKALIQAAATGSTK